MPSIGVVSYDACSNPMVLIAWNTSSLPISGPGNVYRGQAPGGAELGASLLRLRPVTRMIADCASNFDPNLRPRQSQVNTRILDICR